MERTMFNAGSGYLLECTNEIAEQLGIYASKDFLYFKQYWNDNTADNYDILRGVGDNYSIRIIIDGKEVIVYFYRTPAKSSWMYNNPLKENQLYIIFKEEDLYTKSYTSIGLYLKYLNCLPSFTRWVEE